MSSLTPGARRGHADRDAPSAVWLAAICGIVAAAGFTLLWIVAGAFEHHYDNFRQDISDFGALNATHPDVYNTFVVVTGVLVVIFAAGLIAAIGRTRDARIGCSALLLFGVCQILDGVFREDCSPSGDRACRAALDAGRLSWHHQAHDIESVVWFAAIIAAAIALGLAMRGMPRWEGLSSFSFAAAAVSLAAIVWYAVLYFASDGSAYSGVLERMAAAAGWGWLGLMAVRLERLARHRRPRSLSR